MEEQLVSFKTAKLAVEKGYDGVIGVWRGNHYYNHNGKLDGDVVEQLKESFRIKREQNISMDEADKLNSLKSYPAPTQSLLQKWLREKHNIHIEINEIPIKNNENIIHKFYIVLRGLKHELNLDDDDQGNWYPILSKTHTGYEVFKTYEKALENGLQEALKLI
jgi:hypothetical protein